ncbi:hypothetical protein STPYR_12906 [uncultured Stenotrophomonas sp.]|uniref:Alkaline phosphatase n=1 Tax=uncultured Stenotrophomonas sp. TaxID=165438 RepID=A0A1Y5Q6V0_9GAMM|nr:hypothetical protein STPYR_12906 [uncultured Stenotrophomonas sp.]
MSQKPSSAPLTRPSRLPGTGGRPAAVAATNTSQSSNNCSRPMARYWLPCRNRLIGFLGDGMGAMLPVAGEFPRRGICASRRQGEVH